jgi:Xaa-Pro dipeptidase
MASCSYVVYKGYWCHGHRTGTLRRPVEELNQIYGICRSAQDRALEMIKPGVRVKEVAETIRDAVTPYGFDLLGGRIGHGMGMDYSEQPVPLGRGNENELQAGMTFVVHSVFALPRTNKMFVPLGDVCHLTPKGPELLMKFSRDPFLAGE